MTAEEIRLECLREAIKLCTHQITLPGGGELTFTEPLTLAKQFAAFVLDLEWDEENDEWVEPEADDTELKPQVRAFDDDGQEL